MVYKKKRSISTRIYHTILMWLEANQSSIDFLSVTLREGIKSIQFPTVFINIFYTKPEKNDSKKTPKWLQNQWKSNVNTK